LAAVETIDTSHLGFRPIQKIATIPASSGLIGLGDSVPVAEMLDWHVPIQLASAEFGSPGRI
jgi:hypothetical protein